MATTLRVKNTFVDINDLPGNGDSLLRQVSEPPISMTKMLYGRNHFSATVSSAEVDLAPPTTVLDDIARSSFASEEAEPAYNSTHWSRMVTAEVWNDSMVRLDEVSEPESDDEPIAAVRRGGGAKASINAAQPSAQAMATSTCGSLPSIPSGPEGPPAAMTAAEILNSDLMQQAKGDPNYYYQQQGGPHGGHPPWMMMPWPVYFPGYPYDMSEQPGMDQKPRRERKRTRASKTANGKPKVGIMDGARQMQMQAEMFKMQEARDPIVGGCQSCGGEVRASYKFCLFCGSAVTGG